MKHETCSIFLIALLNQKGKQKDSTTYLFQNTKRLNPETL